MTLPYHSGTDPKEYKSTYKRNTCIPVFITVLFTIGNPQNQLTCPTTDECIKNLWHIYAIEYWSSYTRKNHVICRKKWKELEIMLNKMSQAQRAKYCMFSLVCRV
jgi:hypothetical protein